MPHSEAIPREARSAGLAACSVKTFDEESRFNAAPPGVAFGSPWPRGDSADFLGESPCEITYGFRTERMQRIQRTPFSSSDLLGNVVLPVGVAAPSI